MDRRIATRRTFFSKIRRRIRQLQKIDEEKQRRGRPRPCWRVETQKLKRAWNSITRPARPPGDWPNLGFSIRAWSEPKPMGWRSSLLNALKKLPRNSSFAASPRNFTLGRPNCLARLKSRPKERGPRK